MVHITSGLSYDTNEPVLKNEFEKYGEVLHVRVICDHGSGKSKGYGFVVFDSEEAAATALASMDNQLLEGRHIRVEYAQPKGGEAPKTQDTAFTLSNRNSVQLKKRLARLPLPIPRLETISITPRLTPVSLPGSSFLPH
ncbi:hypothetical protein F2Q69_00000964 [Brassica cretica]|uniref:RRM domain-containing protein n=1 Tax=Brassica cretica TaxID=69181 RepID=A0A8S9P9R8_BRACR|nr:hypothetical protein F2Q69_00000964 [Brassica cretica]